MPVGGDACGLLLRVLGAGARAGRALSVSRRGHGSEPVLPCLSLHLSGCRASLSLRVSVALVTFVAVFIASSSRGGLSQPTGMLVLPPSMLPHCVIVWLRRKGRGARVRWVTRCWTRGDGASRLGAVPESVL
jgi:hypothetical protein